MYIFLLMAVTSWWHFGLSQQLSEIRLTGGPSNYSGRVEVRPENGEWGTVCDDYWDFRDALVVCRQLGLGPALAAHREAHFGGRSVLYYLDDVECIGNEDSLFDCESNRVGDHNCDRNEDASVECVNLDKTIRLVGGIDSSEGRVEIFQNGEWGTVCDDGWDLVDATVVCRQLGFNSALQFQTRAYFGRGSGPVWMTNTQCNGDEDTILDCPHDSRNSCTHREDASVTCTRRSTINDIRLSDGETIFEGRVEVKIGEQWGTVCDDNWSIEDGHVVCRELGYLAATEITARAQPFGEGEGEIWLNNVFCKGNEVSLADCSSDGIGSHNCRHREDAGVKCLTEATYSDVRLTGGRTYSEGRVEIFLNGQWGTICDDSWDLNEAHVVCRELGYPAARDESVSASFGEGSGPIWLDNVNCRGSESSLASCSHNGIGVHDCSHHEDVGVKCQTEATYSDMRLTGGTVDSEGRLEIFYKEQWGTVCNSSWNFNEANVVCRELGYPAAQYDSLYISYGEGSGPIWLDNVRCQGSESSLASCSHNRPGQHDCDHQQDVGVTCQEKGSQPTIENIRLAGGSSSLEGRVEIFVQGDWGTICDSNWGFNEAHVVCRQLGFQLAQDATTSIAFGAGNGRIWLDDVECEGDEENLSNCTTGEFGSHIGCDSDEYAGVICLSEGNPSYIEKIRLAGGSNDVEGRVEILVDGEWGTICDDEWDIDDAHVVCRQLKFDSAGEATTDAVFGAGTGRIWLDNVQCKGNEETLSDCKIDGFGLHGCDHDEDAGVICLPRIGEIILKDGTQPEEGILEVSINGKWEVLCNEEWGISNSYVVCRQLGFASAISSERESIFTVKSDDIWGYYFQCSGDEERLNDCSLIKYDSNYTCESQVVAVTCLIHESGKETGQHSQSVAFIIENWMYIAGTLLLITILAVTLAIGFAVCGRSRKRRTHASRNDDTEFTFHFSPQRPLPNAPLFEDEQYVRMNGKDSYNSAMADKAEAACGGPGSSRQNTYTPAFEQTKHLATDVCGKEESPYATSIFDNEVHGSASNFYQPIGEALL